MDIVTPSPVTRCYRHALRLLPARFRREAEPELLAWFEAGWRDAGRHPAWRARLLLTAAFDLLWTAAAEWPAALRPRPTRPRPGAPPMDMLWQDLRSALRTLGGARLVTAVAVLTVALGVGATTTMMSVANALLLRPPVGVADPAGLVTVHAKSEDGSGFHSFSFREFQALDSAGGGLASLAAYGILAASLRTGDEPQLEPGMLVSAAYFTTLGTRARLGRLPGAEENARGAAPVVVLSDGTWRRRFGADPGIIGRPVTINGQSFTVIGVTEPGFHGQFAGIGFGLWVPLAHAPLLTGRDDFNNLHASWLELVGRLAPGMEPAGAAEALSATSAREGRALGLDWDRGVDVRRYRPVPAEAAAPVGGFLGLLLLLAGFVLLIASANVGTVLLARATTRAREMAVRVALGAGRARLLRQLLLESLALFLAGGAAGAALAVAATRALTSVSLPVGIPLALDFHPDLLVLAVGLLVTLVVGVGFGLAPALQATRSDPALVLREGASSLRLARSRLRGLLVTGQVAGTACLLVTAGLFARGLSRAGEVQPGFTPAGIHTTDLDFQVRNYTDPQGVALVDGLERGAAALPGVRSVASTSMLPLNMSNQSTLVAVPGRPQEANVGFFQTDFTSVSPGYFATLELPLLEGRGFADADRAGAPAVAVVNQTLAARLWPGESPIGKRVEFGAITGGTPTEVVGLAADARYRSLGEAPVPMIYVPLAQQPASHVTLLVRMAGGATAPARALRDAVHALDPELPVGRQADFTDVIAIALLPNRIAVGLAAAFGATGLLLAALGLYGLLAFRVQSRRKEIGIRMALGASGGQIRALVVGEGVRLTGAGVILGLGAAALLARFLGGMLFGVSPLDPGIYLAIGLLLLGVGWLAAMGPTRRALRTEPVEVLRNE